MTSRRQALHSRHGQGGRRVTHTSLTYHLYDDMCDKWTKCTSSPQPCIKLTLTNEREDYKAIGVELLERTRAVSLPVITDTSYQSCLIGIGVTQQMGLSTNDFIPLSMTLITANNKGIRILGDVVIRFPGNSGTRRLQTRQIAYVTTPRTAYSFPAQLAWYWT